MHVQERKEGRQGDREGGREVPVQVSEALNVQHMDLVHEQDAGDKLRHALVDVAARKGGREGGREG